MSDLEVSMMKRVGELNAEIKLLKAELTDCKAEADRLKAEVERLKKPAVIGGYNISEYIRMANSETLEFDNGDIFADMTLPERIKYIVESHARLKAEVERLRKAGDEVASSIQFNEEMAKDYNGPTIVHQCVQRWNAAKEGKSV